MRLLIQRVKNAQVFVGQDLCGSIQRGLLVFLGIHKSDERCQTKWLVNKLVNLRIFPDENGKMHLSVKDVKGDILVVSQCTLYANCSGGRRPDFFAAADGPQAKKIYDQFIGEVKDIFGSAQAGKFGAHMEVSLINEGPFTVILDGKSG